MPSGEKFRSTQNSIFSVNIIVKKGGVATPNEVAVLLLSIKHSINFYSKPSKQY